MAGKIKCPNCGFETEDPGDDGPLSCDLCQFVLRRETPPAGAAAPEQPPQDLERRFESFARHIVQNTSDYPELAGIGLDLDYTPGSLLAVDLAIDLAVGEKGQAPDADINSYNLSKEQLGTQLAFGSYYGEVCRRALGGAWQRHPKWAPAMGKDAELTTVRMVFGQNSIQPVFRAIWRFKNGASNYFSLELQELSKALGVQANNWGTGFIKQAGLILDRGTLPIERRAPMIGWLCKCGLNYDPALGPEVIAITSRLSKYPPTQQPPGEQVHIPDKKYLDAAAHQLSGELADGAGKFPEAAAGFREALRHDPQNPDTWRRLAAAQAAMGEFKEAGASLDKALELRPGDPETLLGRAVALDLSGRHDEAARQAAALLSDPSALAAIKTKTAAGYSYLLNKGITQELRQFITSRLA